jgi:drug/metabolite transporter (DMT)-like permease
MRRPRLRWPGGAPATKDEKLSASRLTRVLLGIVGVAVMIGPGAFAGGGGSTLARTAVLGSAISYAFAAIWGRLFRQLPPTNNANGQKSASVFVMAPVALLTDRPWSLAVPSSRVVGAILALALPGTAAGYIVYFAVLARAGSTNVLLVTLLIPPSALLLGALFLAESVAARDMAAWRSSPAGRLPSTVASPLAEETGAASASGS